MRHNLSINPHFRKGARAPQGAGHLWSLAANAIDLLPLRNNDLEKKTEVLQEMVHVIECPKVKLVQNYIVLRVKTHLRIKPAPQHCANK